ncbi:MAG: hypothetical protein H7Y41_07090, partial [Hyphomonadaceae bacterium]|nr:hypothetical protein [Clostridia bacterium]
MQKKFTAGLVVMLWLLMGNCTVLAATDGNAAMYAVNTDIVTYINHYIIASYNIDGNTAVIAEDLSNYGFQVTRDDEKKTIEITRSTAKEITPVGTVYKNIKPVGSVVAEVLKSDIKMVVNGVEVDSYQIDGKNIVFMNSLKPFGEVGWVGELKAVKMWMPDLHITAFTTPPQPPIVTPEPTITTPQPPIVTPQPSITTPMPTVMPNIGYNVYPYSAYSYEFMKSDAQKLANMYPDLIKTSTIGRSLEGRDIQLIQFGKGDKKIFVCGTHHAREYITTTYLMYAIDQYAHMYGMGENAGDFNIKEILDNVTFCIVPMVNPDGVALVQGGTDALKSWRDFVKKLPITESKQYGYRAWKANAGGVDLNWNYDFNWNAKRNKNGRASTGFNGDYPNTEPEVQAMTTYIASVEFQAFLSMHTQGQVIYWADGINKKTGIGEMVKKDTGFIDITDNSSSPYGGSFFDYVHGKYGRPTMTVDLCKYVGNYPYPDHDFD